MPHDRKPPLPVRCRAAAAQLISRPHPMPLAGELLRASQLLTAAAAEIEMLRRRVRETEALVARYQDPTAAPVR